MHSSQTTRDWDQMQTAHSFSQQQQQQQIQYQYQSPHHTQSPHQLPLRPTPIKFVNDNSNSNSYSHSHSHHPHYHRIHPQINPPHKQYNNHNLTPSYSKNTPTTYPSTQPRLSTSNTNSTYIRYHSPVEPEITPSSTPLTLKPLNSNSISQSQISDTSQMDSNFSQYNNRYIRNKLIPMPLVGNNPHPEIHNHNICINGRNTSTQLTNTSSLSSQGIYSPDSNHSIRSAPITPNPPKLNMNQTNINPNSYKGQHSKSTFSLQFKNKKRNKNKKKHTKHINNNDALRTRALSAQPHRNNKNRMNKPQLNPIQSNQSMSQGRKVLNVLNTLNLKLRDTYSGSMSMSQSRSNEHTNSSSFMVFQPDKTNNSMEDVDILDKIGLAEYKQNEYIEVDFPQHKPVLRRAGTEPNHNIPNNANIYNNNATYGFAMTKTERRKQAQQQHHQPNQPQYRYNLHSQQMIYQRPPQRQHHQRTATYNHVPLYHQQQRVPLQHSYTNPSHVQQHNIYTNYPTHVHSPRQQQQQQQQQHVNMNYNMQQHNNNNNNNASLDAQIRAHHNDITIESDEATDSESESETESTRTGTDFVDSESETDSTNTDYDSDRSDSNDENVDNNNTNNVGRDSHSKQTNTPHTNGSSNKISTVWSRTTIGNEHGRLSESESDIKFNSNKHTRFSELLAQSTKTLSETHESFQDITPDITPRHSMIIDNHLPDSYVPNMAVIYDDSLSVTNSKSLEKSKSKLITSYSHKSIPGLKDVPKKKMQQVRSVDSDNKEQIESHLLLISNEKKDYSKSKKTIILLKQALKREILFVGLTDKMIDKIVEKMYCINVEKGQCIIRQNEIGNAYFIVENGQFLIIKGRKCVGTMGTKSAFGEGSLLYSIPRTATLKASENSIVWALDANEFKKIRQKLTMKKTNKLDKKVKFLQKIKLFNKLHISDIKDISEAMKPIRFAKGTKIITENEESTHFYVVYKGQCKVYSKNKFVCEYSHCDCFGDSGIINNKLSDFSVIPFTDVICYVLKAMDFKKVLNAIHCKQTSFDGYKQIKFGKFENIIQTDLMDLTSIGVIGNNRFGNILLVEDNKCNKTYALKKIHKNKIKSTNQRLHLKNERAILATLNSKFCIELYGTYSDNLHVYLLMEAILGSELYYLLKTNKKFPEKTARFYAGCVILAFEHIHALNVIYRELKPEHLLINNNGYIKLIDFGFSKIRNNSCTLCGKPEYLAPEVIQCSYQSFTTDWWTLGILIYEMIYGQVPFKDDPNVKMYEKILSAAPNFPNNTKISRGGLHIIQSLLHKNQSKRLGSGIFPFGLQTVKKHKWFNKFNWDKLEKQLITPPYIPNIENNVKNNVKNVKNEKKLIQNENANIYDWCDEF